MRTICRSGRGHWYRTFPFTELLVLSADEHRVDSASPHRRPVKAPASVDDDGTWISLTNDARRQSWRLIAYLKCFLTVARRRVASCRRVVRDAQAFVGRSLSPWVSWETQSMLAYSSHLSLLPNLSPGNKSAQ
ncbi:hypothetical protein HGRIS_002633 [Hohenbuehelia grisea]|uniref:Uncharacterized protein n=1 Tax=Hohenbuehelia grisea TaxID=104357 RepID=A0ABR3JL89_9AGAR